jgi:tetratricopeptide (TPR) repeat protein
MKTLVSLIAFSVISLLGNSQTIQNADSVSINEKAIYPKQDLAKFLMGVSGYPLEALKENINGDVFISFIITKDGKLDSLTVESSPDNALSKSSITTCNALKEQWIPAKINHVPANKKYLFIFRYRVDSGTQSANFKSMADKKIKKQDYEKALLLYDKAILGNPYDYRLFQSRSKVKLLLGDEEGARIDQRTSERLNNEIMSVIDVGVIRTTRYLGSTVVITRTDH